MLVNGLMKIWSGRMKPKYTVKDVQVVRTQTGKGKDAEVVEYTELLIVDDTGKEIPMRFGGRYA
jgi:hypothetical protein